MSGAAVRGEVAHGDRVCGAARDSIIVSEGELVCSNIAICSFGKNVSGIIFGVKITRWFFSIKAHLILSASFSVICTCIRKIMCSCWGIVHSE